MAFPLTQFIPPVSRYFIGLRLYHTPRTESLHFDLRDLRPAVSQQPLLLMAYFNARWDSRYTSSEANGQTNFLKALRESGVTEEEMKRVHFKYIKSGKTGLS